MLFLDGAMGTQLQRLGLAAGETPEDWNLDRPEAVREVHRAYVAAGAQIVYANTFGASPLKYHGHHDFRRVIDAGVRVASGLGARVALDLGPSGRLLAPAGDFAFEDAVANFAEVVRVGVAAGAELIAIETMTDLRELKAAVIAAKENSSLPIYATVALQENGTLLTGGGVETVAAVLEGLRVDAYGFNCGLGPDRMLEFVERLCRVSSRPIIVKPNAGMPEVVDGETRFPASPEQFAADLVRLVAAGASIVGGCCGTTPAHLAAAREALAAFRGKTAAENSAASGASAASAPIASAFECLELKPGAGIIIGERINPTGKKKLKEAYLRGDQAYVLREAVAQIDAGAAALDVNCGVPGIDEAATLDRTLEAVQAVVNCPLQIDTADAAALELALRHVNGKPLVNSVNGKRESMDAVFPLVAKYGGVIVALCLDEDGIPPTSDGRLAIARRILAEGAKYGFSEKDFVFDALTLAVSADPDAAAVTLETVRRLTEELGVNTVLGVSNVSFGLPNRVALNNAMYALAKRAGLSAAIANPAVIRDETAAGAADVLLGRDRAGLNWIAANSAPAADASATASATPAATAEARDALAELKRAIIRGLKADAAAAAAEALGGREPVAVIDGAIVPALEEVGRGFETGRLYLPQLLMAADAAGEAFAAVRKRLATARPGAGASPIVIATVKGDIHDIGKNIVRALLENHGFDVIDLGRDVAPETIVAAAVKAGSTLVGLSALMTTTVKAMAETVRQLHAADPSIRVFVGGAVVTEEYAREIGADYYTKDAMASVRLAKKLLG